MATKKIVTRERLIEDYVNSPGVSISQLARKYGMCQTTLKRRMVECGIETIDVRRFGHRQSKYPMLRDKAWLQQAIMEKPIPQIAKELGVPVKTIHDHVSRHKLQYPNGVWRRYGDKANNWRGGVRKASGGHTATYIPDHQFADSHGYVMTHRLVAEKSLGRLLNPDEIVHHLNGIPDDNRPENLKVLTITEHRQLHMNALRRCYELEQQVNRLQDVLRSHGIEIPS